MINLNKFYELFHRVKLYTEPFGRVPEIIFGRFMVESTVT